MRVWVQDNGAGFASDRIPAQPRRSGLNNMRQRIETLGGRFTVQTDPGKGTTIEILIPFPEEPK